MSFDAWLKKRIQMPSMADEVIDLIRQAGPAGSTSGELNRRSQIPNHLLHRILKELLRDHRVSAIGTNGKTVYVAR
jgi:hypothetical protein